MPSIADPSGLILSGVYLVGLMLLGYALLCIAMGSGTRHWLELLGLSFAAGAGVTSTVLFWASLLGHPPDRLILAALLVVSLAVILFAWKNKKCPSVTVPAPMEKFSPMSLLALLGLGLIVAAVTNVITESSWTGLSDVDSYAIWMLKAKILAMQPLCPIPPAMKSPPLSFSHQDYPLSLPLLVAGLYGMLGHMNDEQAKIILLPIYWSLMALIYSAVRRLHRRQTAIALTAIFTASPALTHNAAALVAETPLLLMWTGAVAMLLRWIETNKRNDLLLAGLFSAFAAFTKNEGLALLPVIGAVGLGMAIARRNIDRLKDGFLAAIASLATIAPWLIYRNFLPRTHEDYGTKLTHSSALLSNLSRISYILPQFLGRMFDAPRVGMIWYLLVLTALLGFRGFIRPAVISLWIVLLLQVALYIATFVVTPWNVHELLPLVGPKLLTQASPVAVLLIALHLRQIRWTA